MRLKSYRHTRSGVSMEFWPIKCKATRKWVEDGKKRQETKTFEQTLNPYNKNPNGTVKTEEEILEEVTAEAQAFRAGKDPKEALQRVIDIRMGKIKPKRYPLGRTLNLDTLPEGNVGWHKMGTMVALVLKVHTIPTGHTCKVLVAFAIHHGQAHQQPWEGPTAIHIPLRTTLLRNKVVAGYLTKGGYNVNKVRDEFGSYFA